MAKVLFDYELMRLLQDFDQEAAIRLNTTIKTALNEAADTVVRHFGIRRGEPGGDGDYFLVRFYSDGPSYRERCPRTIPMVCGSNCTLMSAIAKSIVPLATDSPDQVPPLVRPNLGAVSADECAVTESPRRADDELRAFP